MLSYPPRLNSQLFFENLLSAEYYVNATGNPKKYAISDLSSQFGDTSRTLGIKIEVQNSI